MEAFSTSFASHKILALSTWDIAKQDSTYNLPNIPSNLVEGKVNYFKLNGPQQSALRRYQDSTHLLSERLITLANSNHMSVSLGVRVWKMMCQHLFLKIISNIFVVGTGQKFWYDQGMRGIFLYEDPTMLGRCQSRALNNLSNFKGGFNQLPWCRWGTLPLTPPLKPLWVNVNEIAPPNFQCRAR